MKSIHPMGVVVRRTGLSSHVIRAWERRYNAVHPHRTEGNHRLYSDEDIDRLMLLAKATDQGASIAGIAQLSLEELQNFVLPERKKPSSPPLSISVEEANEEQDVQAALTAIENMDPEGLNREMSGWLVRFGVLPVIEQLVPRLMTEIGNNWSSGKYRIYQEHMATQAVRNFLGGIFEEIAGRSEGPTVLTATPPGEMHEIGALLCAVAASIEGFRVLHLGADVPFPELIHAIHQQETAAVMISIVSSSHDSRLAQGLMSLRSMIMPETYIFIGGGSAGWYGEQVKDDKFEVIPSINGLRKRLKKIK